MSYGPTAFQCSFHSYWIVNLPEMSSVHHNKRQIFNTLYLALSMVGDAAAVSAPALEIQGLHTDLVAERRSVMRRAGVRKELTLHWMLAGFLGFFAHRARLHFWWWGNCWSHLRLTGTRIALSLPQGDRLFLLIHVAGIWNNSPWFQVVMLVSNTYTWNY